MLWAGTKSHKAWEERFRWWEGSKRVYLHSQHASSFWKGNSFSYHLSEASNQNRDPSKVTKKKGTAGHFGSTEVLQNLLDVLQLGCCMLEECFVLVLVFFPLCFALQRLFRNWKISKCNDPFGTFRPELSERKTKNELNKGLSSWEKWRQSWGLVVIPFFPTKMKYSQLLVAIKKKVLMLADFFQHSSSDSLSVINIFPCFYWQIEHLAIKKKCSLGGWRLEAYFAT